MGETIKQLLNSPYHAVARSLLDKGLVTVPLRELSKAPFVPNWTSLTVDEARKHLDTKAIYNVGLLLGKPSGILALDFDNNMDGLHQKILKICGQSEVIKKGEKGGTIFFRYNGEKSKKWKKSGEMVLELLSDGTQTVLPPSVHPGTKAPYVYTKGKTLDNIELTELPYLPTDFEQRIDALFEGKDFMAGSDLDIAREALYFITPDDYDTWLQCGMALKNDFGEEGFEVWEKWSATHPKCRPDELYPKWESFKGEGITCGTIFKLAIENGFTPPKNASSFYNVGNAKIELDRWRLKGRPVGYTTGVQGFDRHLHLRKKEFTIVTGTPNSGKSEFLDHLLYSVTKTHNLKCMFASFEKDPALHVESFVHRITKKDLDARSTEEEQAALRFIQEHFFFYNHLYETRDIDKILAKAEELVKKAKIDILAIDPFSYLTSKEIVNEFAHVRHTCIKINKFTKKTGCHVILVAHPKTLETRKIVVKEGEEAPRLSLYAISGGATFYNNCDNGIVISRDGKEIEVDIQKVRQQETDSCGRFVMEYNKPTRTFTTYRGEY